MRFYKQQRLRRQSDFHKVRERGRTFRCPHFFLQFQPKVTCGNEERRRIGIITSRRVGNAVKRNRGRRLFREIFRRNQDSLPKCCDLVVVVRSCYNVAGFDELQELYLKAVNYTSK
ncbi:MAG: ribonuclease P protein component [Opitutae bacterium]|nr:ribonuclease P protein component [Opitutae bacterium]MBT5379513.1 ribonuclease P protein component [Opitutae bacterium]MBT5691092.1 ribonuclease P protein component [Opitutae bacterium]MBT6462400.1 ribonuclease P protein component [Opitutae bacterium]MBT7853146.1 ribonuclease P protein component [Opitutae bacterium]